MITLTRWLLPVIIVLGMVTASAAPDGKPTPPSSNDTAALCPRLVRSPTTNPSIAGSTATRSNSTTLPICATCSSIPRACFYSTLVCRTRWPGVRYTRAMSGATAGALGLIVMRTFRSQLADIGYTPDMIDYPLLSHSHFDHIGNVGMFLKSTWLVQKPEWDFMFGMTNGKPTKNLEHSATMNAMRTDFVSDDDYDVFGDGVVIIKRAYGYTPGSNVLAVNLRDTGWIAGSC